MAKHTVTVEVPNKPDFNLYLDIDTTYQITQKPIPAPTPFEKGQITWFNAFGVTVPGRSGKTTPTAYTVRFKRPPVRAGETLRIFYYADGTAHEITQFSVAGGNVSFELNLTDPPVGYYP